MSSDPIVSHGRGGNTPLALSISLRLSRPSLTHSPPASGAGNIEHDERAYADGEIVREGPLGDQGDGAYSAGVRPPFPFSSLPSPSKINTTTNPPSFSLLTSNQRGGAGNMESPRIPPRKGSAVPPGDVDVVPETAMRPAGQEYENFHTGRGGGGNVHREKEGHEHEHESLKERAKHLFGGGGGKKEGEGEGT